MSDCNENAASVPVLDHIGAGRRRYVFIHPASTNGVLLELIDGGM